VCMCVCVYVCLCVCVFVCMCVCVYVCLCVYVFFKQNSVLECAATANKPSYVDRGGGLSKTDRGLSKAETGGGGTAQLPGR
jgi:hypothetical protein